MVVYGVENTPKLSSSFLNNDINITVPNLGIILTSSKTSKNISTADSSNNEVKITEAGYGFSFNEDSVNCGNKRYHFVVLLSRMALSGPEFKKDITLMRDIKKELACKMISEKLIDLK